MNPRISCRVTVEIEGTIATHLPALQEIEKLSWKHGVNVLWTQYPGSVLVSLTPSSKNGQGIAAVADLVDGLTDAVTGADNWLGKTSGMAFFHAASAARHLKAIGLEPPNKPKG